MIKSNLTRRDFIKVSSAVAATALITLSCDGSSGTQNATGNTRTIFRLSARGRRGSQAAKSHNANMRFATIEAADQNRAHLGDHSRIVSLVIRRERFNELFNNGRISVVDLRHF